jgi:hypothetical protein
MVRSALYAAIGFVAISSTALASGLFERTRYMSAIGGPSGPLL